MKCLIIGGASSNNIPYKQMEQFQNECIRIGNFLASEGHSLIVCSPFEDSADYWVLKGYSEENSNNKLIEIHFIDTEPVKSKINEIESELGLNGIIKIQHLTLDNNEQNLSSVRYSWLLCQLEALETCHFIIAIGGKSDGAANMLLLLAESKRKIIIPLTYFGGAASDSFNRRRYELQDNLGGDFLLLQDKIKIWGQTNFHRLLSLSQINNTVTKYSNVKSKSFFISYSRNRPEEADYIETLLRRRNLKVFRDENDFGAGSSIPSMITEEIHSANIFIAVWCKEYACSPWCFDEFELALDRYEKGKMELWIFCPDKTRMVPKRARKLLYYNVSSRVEIEGIIVGLLERNESNID